MKRVPLLAVVMFVAVAVALALMVGLLSVRADCPEPTPPGGCRLDTISPPTQTPPALTGEPYPGPDPYPAPPTPASYPGPAYLPWIAEGYPAP